MSEDSTSKRTALIYMNVDTGGLGTAVSTVPTGLFSLSYRILCPYKLWVTTLNKSEKNDYVKSKNG